MKLRHYCTYFDANYLGRGLALLLSLRKNSSEKFVFHILCLDDFVFNFFTTSAFRDVIPVSLAVLEQSDIQLKDVRDGRSWAEYAFTMTGCFARHLFAVDPDLDQLTYLDADTFLFSDPKPVFDEIGDAAVAITPHRFHDRNLALKVHGIFNVGWVTWRRSEAGLRCLDEYRRDCLDWCHDYVDGNRYADQRYLDGWPVRYPGVKVIDHPGVNLAPWNLDAAPLSAQGPSVGGRPLVLYHFHKFRQSENGGFTAGLESYQPDPSRLDSSALAAIYGPYDRLLRRLGRFGGALAGPGARQATASPTVHPLAQLPRLQHTADWIPTGEQAPGWEVPAVVEGFAEAYRAMERRRLATAPLADNSHRFADIMTVAALVAAKAAEGRPVRAFDWGGGVGTLGLALTLALPGLDFAYHCHDQPALLAQARKLAGTAILHDRLEDADGGGGFDLVCAIDSLHYSRDWRGTLRHLCRLCTDRLLLGHVPLVFSVPGFTMIHRLFDHRFRTAFSCWAINHHEVVALMDEAGFRLEREMPSQGLRFCADAPEHCESQSLLFVRRGKEGRR